MQSYDLVMVVILAGATLFGVWKGLAWQIASIAALVASYIGALRLSPFVAPHISAQEPWNRYLAMLVVYIGCSFGIWVAFGIVTRKLEKSDLKGFDRQIGGLVGLVAGAILCLVVTFFAVTLTESSRNAVLRSRSGYYIAAAIDKAGPIMPGELKETLRPYLERLDAELKGEPRPEGDAPPANPATGETGPFGLPFGSSAGTSTGSGGAGGRAPAAPDRTTDPLGGFARELQQRAERQVQGFVQENQDLIREAARRELDRAGRELDRRLNGGTGQGGP